MRIAQTCCGLLLLAGPTAAQVVDAADIRKKIDLRVLVTGVEGSARLVDFREFLAKEFRKVGTTSYSDFSARDADGYDVVVFDAPVTPSPRSIGLPKAPQLTKGFDRASVLVSGAGAILARPLGLKTDWG